MKELRVAAVVVTYNRKAILAETLRAVNAQSRPPDRVYVVDNASTDGTDELLRVMFPDALHFAMPDNLGCAGGLARGLDAAWTDGFDAYWLLDDDSPPESDALEALLETRTTRAVSDGIVGCQGGMIRYGLIRHFDEARSRRRGISGGPVSADFVMLDGSLVSRAVVDAVGVPRADYFMMLEDVEYSLRAGRAGFNVHTFGRDLVRRRQLGSVPGTSLWRGYYQSRNHLRMALDFRSPTLVFGYIARQLHIIFVSLRAPNRRWERIALRLRGVSDGLRGRMGRRVHPDKVTS